jgi:hypothetical protein
MYKHGKLEYKILFLRTDGEDGEREKERERVSGSESKRRRKEFNISLK